MPRIPAASALVYAASLLLSVATVCPQDGTFDPSFGGDGRVSYQVVPGQSDRIFGMALQPDDKIVLAGSTCDDFECPTTSGDLLLLRLSNDGSLDPTFGAGGVVVLGLDFGGSNYDRSIGDPVVLPTGEIVIAASASAGAADTGLLLRFLSNGQLDPAFGDFGGIALPGLGPPNRAHAVARQADGKLVVVGSIANPVNGTTDVLVLRFTAGGELDSTFGIGGAASFDLALGGASGELDEYGIVVFVDHSGRIVVGGAAQYAGADWDGFVLRLTSVGELDGGFGMGGLAWLFVDLGGTNHDAVASLVLDPGGGLYASGFSATPDGADSWIQRLDATGFLDPAFADNGLLRLDLALGTEIVESFDSVRLDVAGRVLAAGYATSAGTDMDMVAVRCRRDGSLDPTFGTAGVLRVGFDLGPNFDTDQAFSLSLQNDERILVAGLALRDNTVGAEAEAAAFRLLVEPVGIFEDGFESGDTTAWSATPP